MRYSAHLITTHISSKQTVSIKLYTDSFNQLARVLSIYHLKVNQLDLVRYGSLYYQNSLFTIQVARQTSVNGPKLNKLKLFK